MRVGGGWEKVGALPVSILLYRRVHWIGRNPVFDPNFAPTWLTLRSLAAL